MNPIPRIPLFARFRSGLLLLCSFLLLVLAPPAVQAQADSAGAPAADTTAPAEETPAEAAEESLISPSISFTAVQKSDNSIDLKAALQAKVKGQFVKLYKMKVSFYRVVNGEDQLLGFVITDGNGKALYNLKGDTLKTDAEGKLNFKAVFAGNKSMEAAEENVSFRRARLEITPVKEDSLLSVQVKLVDLGSGTETPVKEAAVGIYVKRQFLPLKTGEGTTDEAGEATIEFPNGLPGDPKGNLTIYGRLDEHELYGNLEASVVQPWGTPVSDKLQKLPRALWGTQAPMWMLITFIVLMATVWGHYIVIIYELFRLRKEEPHSPADATKL